MSNLPDSFRLIFHDSPLGVAVVLQTGDGTLDHAMMLYANPALMQLIRHKDPDNFDFVSVIREMCVDEEGRSLLPLAQDPHDMKSIFVRIKMPEDKSIWLEVRAQPTTILGERAHFFWFTDVTETKEQETIAKREAAKADAAAQAKSAFLATMSHEIRTPMQTIFGMLELMKDEDSIPRMLEMANAAQHSANGLLGILDDILDLAKVDAGRMELDLFEVPIRKMISVLIESMDAKRRENNLHLNMEVADTVPEVILCDPKRMRQILTNLISNGLKFTEHGGVTIRLSMLPKYITADDQHIPLRFEVIDTGIGMTHETASRLFQPFTQADNSTMRKFGGTGLGLSIAHRLVELMGGQIGVTSEIGKGSVFWFEIPSLKTEARVAVPLPDLTGVSVLAIEDSPGGFQEIHSTLLAMKADVITVSNATEAIALAEKRPFDVALVDYGLPDMDGIELLKKLHVLRPFMGSVLYTARNDYAILQACKFVGAKYLEKPASRVVIGETIKSATKRVRPASSKPQKLLVCEDNESVRDIIQRQLSKLGLTADFAENGALGWNIIQRGEHSVVITDLHMPEMDGYGLVKAVRAQEAENNSADRLPVIAMTADVQLVHQQVYLEHGFDECLLKPVSIGQLRQLLIRWGVIKDDSEATTEPVATETPVTAAPPVTAEPEPVPQSKPEPESKPEPVAEIAPIEIVTAPAEDKPPADTAITLTGLPVFDRNLAEQQFGAFDDEAIDMVKMFIQISTPQIAQMEGAFKDREWEKLKGLAHSLKGAARSACCLQLGDIAEYIQNNSPGGHVNASQINELKAAFTNAATMSETLTA